jgi:thiamine pyrophosphokinase
MTGGVATTTGCLVILADGARPSHEAALSVFHSAAAIVACDGAWRTAVSLGRIPNAVVGDCDSLAKGDFLELERLGVTVVREQEQDTNDLCKAFRYAMRFCNANRIVILGATGKREDHSLGNIFHLVDFALTAPGISMMTDSGVFEPVLPPGREWECAPSNSHHLSVFATHPDTIMSSKGLKWPLDSVCFDSLWRGTLNRIVSNVFSIRTDRPAIVFRPY